MQAITLVSKTVVGKAIVDKGFGKKHCQPFVFMVVSMQQALLYSSVSVEVLSF